MKKGLDRPNVKNNSVITTDTRLAFIPNAADCSFKEMVHGILSLRKDRFRIVKLRTGSPENLEFSPHNGCIPFAGPAEIQW